MRDVGVPRRSPAMRRPLTFYQSATSARRIVRGRSSRFPDARMWRKPAKAVRGSAIAGSASRTGRADCPPVSTSVTLRERVAGVVGFFKNFARFAHPAASANRRSGGAIKHQRSGVRPPESASDRWGRRAGAGASAATLGKRPKPDFVCDIRPHQRQGRGHPSAPPRAATFCFAESSRFKKLCEGANCASCRAPGT